MIEIDDSINAESLKIAMELRCESLRLAEKTLSKKPYDALEFSRVAERLSGIISRIIAEKNTFGSLGIL